MKNPASFVFASLAILAVSGLASFPVKAESVTNQTAQDESPKTSLRVDTKKAADGSKISTLTVKTDIPKTEVYLDDIYQGLTPLVLSDVKPGIRQLALKKDGYYSGIYRIEIRAGEIKDLYAELARATGYLVIRNAPENAEMVIDGKIRKESVIEVPEGMHSVTIRAFGYRDKTADVRVTRKEETDLDGILESEPFSVSDLKPLKRSFNPENPENLGSSGVTFTVTAPGYAVLTIANADGNRIRAIQSGTFETWKQSLKWDGRDDEGKPLPDGKYRLTLEGIGNSNTAGATGQNALVAEVTIDRKRAYPSTAPWTGTGATGPVVSGSLMPRYQAMVNADALFASDRFSPGLSALAGVTDALEAGFRLGVNAGSGNDAGIDISAGLKGGIPGGIAGGRLKPALAIRYETGLGIAFGPALEWRNGHYGAGINAEIAYGDADGYFQDPFLSASGGIALRFTVRSFSIGAWGQAGTGRDGAEEGTPLSYGTGVSAQWIIPSTSLMLSLDGGRYWIPNGDDILYTRVGSGFVF